MTLRGAPSPPAVSFVVAIAITITMGALVLPSPAAAQTYLGPSKCVACHDHDRQATKWQKDEPAALKGKAHYNTRKQLDDPKAAGYAKAIGLADPYDLKGECVKCHATVFRGDANAGVSCESCHGAASGWNDLHQAKGSYAKAVAAGMRDLREKPPAIAKVCVECHVTPDKRLSAAGHPSGDRFDAGASLPKLVHWTATYDFAQVSSAGRTAAAARAGGAAARPAAPPPAPSPAAKPKPGGAAPSAPSSATGTAATAAAPEAVARPAASPPAAARVPAPPPRAAAPASPPPPWDWDQPIRPLPADYVPEPAPAPAAEAAEPAGPKAPAVAPGATAAVRVPRPPDRVRPPEPVVPPSIAEEMPLPPSLPGVPDSPAVSAAVVAEPPVTPAAPVRRPPAAEVVAVRGRAVAMLDKMLRAGGRAADLPPAARPAEFSGPDSELLRLQDEVLALAIEALRRPK